MLLSAPRAALVQQQCDFHVLGQGCDQRLSCRYRFPEDSHRSSLLWLAFSAPVGHLLFHRNAWASHILDGTGVVRGGWTVRASR